MLLAGLLVVAFAHHQNLFRGERGQPKQYRKRVHSQPKRPGDVSIEQLRRRCRGEECEILEDVIKVNNARNNPLPNSRLMDIVRTTYDSRGRARGDRLVLRQGYFIWEKQRAL
jgi:hypothetical protein